MSEYMQKIQTAADTIRQAVGGADVGIILGSGLGDYVEALEEARAISYANIPGFPRSTVPGHKRPLGNRNAARQAGMHDAGTFPCL